MTNKKWKKKRWRSHHGDYGLATTILLVCLSLLPFFFVEEKALRAFQK
jgi:hypothetical protein